MPQPSHADSLSSSGLQELRGLLSTIYGAEHRRAAATAAITWLSSFTGAHECRVLSSEEAPAQPVFDIDQWRIPAYIKDRLAGGIALQFSGASDSSKAEPEFLSACAEVIVWVDQQAREEEQVSLVTRRFLQFEETEKRRIGRDLHDNAAQQLAVVRLQMELLQMSPKNGDELIGQLAMIREVTEKTIGDVRRLIANLSPSVLDQLGLMAAIRQLANRFTAEYACQITVEPGPPLAIDTDTQLTMYRLVQSAFRLFAQNLEATHLNISLSQAEGVLGVSLQGTVSAVHLPAEGRSLDLRGTGLWDRLTLLGGTVTSQILATSARESHVLLSLQIRELTTNP